MNVVTMESIYALIRRYRCNKIIDIEITGEFIFDVTAHYSRMLHIQRAIRRYKNQPVNVFIL